MKRIFNSPTFGEFIFVAHMTMEKHIIERLKLGDEKAFKYIYDCHYVLLCRFAYQLLDDSSLSEEVVDDAIFICGSIALTSRLLIPSVLI